MSLTKNKVCEPPKCEVLCFDKLTNVDSKSSIQSKKAAELEYIHCRLDSSLLLVA